MNTCTSNKKCTNSHFNKFEEYNIISNSVNIRINNSTNNVNISDGSNLFVNEINHINHRPSNLYFNPSRLNEDNQYSINDNTFEYYTSNEFVKAFITSNNSFSILNLNIRSISKNIGKLKKYLNIIKHNFSVITIQETWFTEDTCDMS